MISTVLDLTQPLTSIRYGRMSGEEQNPRSPEQQFDEVERTRRRCGYPWQLLVDYRDDAISGRLLKKRPGFQQMLNDIRSGRVRPDLILVDTWERLGRAEELEPIRLELKNRFGVTILTADSNFTDPNTVAGRALGFVQQLRAVEDGRVKAHNVLRGKRDAIQRKRWPGGSPPLGFRLESKLVAEGGLEQLVRGPVEDPATGGVVRLLFETARATGCGVTRLVKMLNADPRVPASLKPLRPSLVRGMLSNRLYVGTMVYLRLATDVVDDTHVVRKNAAEDHVVVDDFCPALVDRATFDAVQELIAERARRHRLARAAKSGLPAAAKRGAPVVQGVALKYPLSGLVRCGHCGRSMPPHAGGRNAKNGTRYTYYVCPAGLHGECDNRFLIREAFLRRDVWAILRARLFPDGAASSAGAAAAGVPPWMDEVVGAVKRELTRRTADGSDHRAALARERLALAGQRRGWMQSLSDPSLDEGLRREIQTHFAASQARERAIDADLAALEAQRERLEDLAAPAAVRERLDRLDELMDGTNAAVLNLELARHVDRIEGYGDGRVVVRTCKLGGLASDAAESLAAAGRDDADDDAGLAAAPPATATPARRSFPLPRRRVRGGGGCYDDDLLACNLTAPDPDRYAGLGPEWFWEDAFFMNVRSCWAAENARAVARFVAETGASVNRAAAHFGKAKQTIRNAMRKAAEQAERDARLAERRRDGDRGGVADAPPASVTLPPAPPCDRSVHRPPTPPGSSAAA